MAEDLGFPLQISDITEERYARCTVPGCERLARWWPAEAWQPGRWVHEAGRDERFVDFPNHHPEVTPDA